jgi:hypothetical protein
MNYINTSTKTVHSEQAIRSANPNMSFPSPFIPPVGYEIVFDAPHPTHDPITQTVKEWPPVLTDKGHYEQAWEVVNLSPDQVLLNRATKVENDRTAAKAQREVAVASIKITTTAGHTFDGDEASQGRMARAIIALSTGLAPSVNWVLADNSVIQATTAELTEALVLAGQAQASLWVLP